MAVSSDAFGTAIGAALVEKKQQQRQSDQIAAQASRIGGFETAPAQNVNQLTANQRFAQINNRGLLSIDEANQFASENKDFVENLPRFASLDGNGRGTFTNASGSITTIGDNNAVAVRPFSRGDPIGYFNPDAIPPAATDLKVVTLTDPNGVDFGGYSYKLNGKVINTVITYGNLQENVAQNQNGAFVNSVGLDNDVGFNFETRALGAIQVFGGIATAMAGSTAVVAGVALAPETLGAGLLLAGVGSIGITIGADQARSGLQALLTGNAMPTLTGQGIQYITGASPQTAELTAGLLALSPAAVETRLANQATRAFGAANAFARTTTSFESVPATAQSGINRLANSNQFLIENGIASQELRQKIIAAGLRTDLLDTNFTPATLARFNKLFPQTVAAGKSFSGRLGNLDTRVATINQAAELERAGYTVRFEFPVAVDDGGKRFVDLAGLSQQSGMPNQFIQFVKFNKNSIIIRPDELNAARQIENALKLSPGAVKLINTKRLANGN